MRRTPRPASKPMLSRWLIEQLEDRWTPTVTSGMDSESTLTFTAPTNELYAATSTHLDPSTTPTLRSPIGDSDGDGPPPCSQCGQRGCTRHVTPDGIVYALPPAPSSPPTGTAGGGPVGAPPFPTTDTFLLSSLPNAKQTIYLDFFAKTLTGTRWNTLFNQEPLVRPQFDFDSNPAKFSDEEHEVIQRVFLSVAEDFAPFNVNVTTKDPGTQALQKTSPSDPEWGIRVIFGGDNSIDPTAGGRAWLDSFSFSKDEGVLVYGGGSRNIKFLAGAASHEVGHSFGLEHDGQVGGIEYYFGHKGVNNGPGWAPIMGADYNEPLGQWSRGQYFNANQTQDDLSLITQKQHGVTYRADDYAAKAVGSGQLTLTPVLGNQFTFSKSGLISQTNDVDWLELDLSQGTSKVSIQIDPASYAPNLDILAKLLDANGLVLATSDIDNSLSATFPTRLLQPGKYYISIDGTGVGDPFASTPTGYTDYGSLGTYQVTGVVEILAEPTQTTLLAGAPNPSQFGQDVTFSAVVASLTKGTPTGLVEFFDNGTLLGSAPLQTVQGAQVATFTTPNISLGTRGIQAKFVANADFQRSDSQEVTQVVNETITKVVLAVNPRPADALRLTTLSANISAQFGAPSGLIEFFDGTVSLGTAPITSNGPLLTAKLSVPFDVGNRTITAKYATTGGYLASEDSETLIVVPLSSSISLTANPDATARFTEAVKLTAKVDAELGAPVGTVRFFASGVEIGSANLGTIRDQVGQFASIDARNLPLGTTTFTAVYDGFGNHRTSTTLFDTTITVNPLPTVATLTASPSSSVATRPVTLTATIGSELGAATGLVQFFDGKSLLAEVPIQSLSGRQFASFTTTELPLGTRTFTAKYLGDTGYLNSDSTQATAQIEPVTTRMTIGAPTNATVGQPVTLSATVLGIFGSPVGNVVFESNGQSLGTAALRDIGGRQTAIITTMLPPGTTTVTARYAAQDRFNAAEPQIATVEVAKAPATVNLLVTPTASRTGEFVTIQAAVSLPGQEQVPIDGTVTFTAGGVTIGSAPVVNGVATLVSKSLPIGEPVIIANYGGTTLVNEWVTSTTATVQPLPTAPPVPPISPPLPPPPPPPPPPPVIATSPFVRSGGFAIGAGPTIQTSVLLVDANQDQVLISSIFDDFTGGVRTAAADFNGDGIVDVLAGTGPGSTSGVVIVDGKTQTLLFGFQPFESSFTGGVYVTAGDLTADGKPEMIITPDEGGGPRIRVFTLNSAGNSFVNLADFFGIDDPNFRGGARASVGDLNGDTVGDLIVSAGFGGGPRVAGFDGKSIASSARRRIFNDFFLFETSLRNGAFITVGDLDGDGFGDLIAGGGPGGAPRVRAISGRQLANDNLYITLTDFFAGNADSRGGVRLAAKDLDGDSKLDILVGAGDGAGSTVLGYRGIDVISSDDPTPAFNFDAFPEFTGGVFVG